MNSVNIGGCITFLSGITQTKSGLNIMTFGIKTKKKVKREDAIYENFKVTAFGNVADYANKYFMKGDYVLVSGTLANNVFTNKDGVQVRECVIVASDIESVRKSEESANEEFASQSENDGFIDISKSNGNAAKMIDDEDLPF